MGTNGPSNSSTSIHIKDDNPQADRPDYCGTQDQNSQTHLCKEIPENCYGSTTGGGARDISNFGRDNERNRLYESSTSGSYQGRSNHEHIKELVKLPHAGQTKVIVLTYDADKPKAEQPKST